VNPKATIVLGPWKRTEIYLDAGTGFHSNDARGVTISVDPTTGAPQDRVPLLVRTRGAEVGVRTASVRGVVSTFSLWVLQSNSELTFSGDSGDTEANGPSRKYGLEWATFYRPADWLTLTANLSLSHARYLQPQNAADGGTGTFIANAIPVVISAAAIVEAPNGIFAGARLRYFGARPIIEDDSRRQPASAIVNATAGYRWRRYEAGLEVLNLFDAKTDDIAYYYPSRLPDSLLVARGLPTEPAAGVADFHVHPTEPIQVRASFTAHY